MWHVTCTLSWKNKGKKILWICNPFSFSCILKPNFYTSTESITKSSPLDNSEHMSSDCHNEDIDCPQLKLHKHMDNAMYMRRCTAHRCIGCSVTALICSNPRQFICKLALVHQAQCKLKKTNSPRFQKDHLWEKYGHFT